jgi:transposase-like protein
LGVSVAQYTWWRRRIAAFRASGLTAAAWTRAEGVTSHQLAYWRRQFPEDDRPEDDPPLDARPAAGEAPFVAVTVAAEADAALVVAVGAARIAVQAGFDPALLRAVVQALGGTPC